MGITAAIPPTSTVQKAQAPSRLLLFTRAVVAPPAGTQTFEIAKSCAPRRAASESCVHRSKCKCQASCNLTHRSLRPISLLCQAVSANQSHRA